MIEQNQHLDALQDIRRMMKRSSKFLSLSGLSGIAAGCWALIGAWFAYDWIGEYYSSYGDTGYSGAAFQKLKHSLLLLSVAVLAAALISAFFFTWRRANRNKLPLWDHTTKTLTINMLIPSLPALKLIPNCGIQGRLTANCVPASGKKLHSIVTAKPKVMIELIKAVCFA